MAKPAGGIHRGEGEGGGAVGGVAVMWSGGGPCEARRGWRGWRGRREPAGGLRT